MTREQLDALKEWVQAAVTQRLQAATQGSASRRDVEAAEEWLDTVMLGDSVTENSVTQ